MPAVPPATARTPGPPENGSGAYATLARLAGEGIALDAVTAQLLDEGLAAFDADLATVVETIESKLEAARSAA